MLNSIRRNVRWLMIAAIVPAVVVFAQPKSRYPGVSIKQIGILGRNTVRIRRDPSSGRLYVLQNTGQVQRVDLGADGNATLTTVFTTSDHGLNAPLGMAFGQDGTMYLVGNDSTGPIGTAMIVKGVPVNLRSEPRTWSVLARTVPYHYGNIYNHRMSGIVVNLTGDSIYVNSGAATDHGEVHDGLRETGLTSIILKLPISGQNILLQDDRAWLKSNGYLFAEGIRNDFDLAYSGNGDLFDVQNSGDRDDPDEMNWLREGRHYGFPWRIGRDWTPQQFVPYNPHTDPLLSPFAWGGGSLYTTFSNDSTYPPQPDSISFTDPVLSYGPDADRFRDTVTGQVKDASTLGLPIPTFTPHRSPDGIVFDRDSILGGDLKGNAFVISYENGALVAALGDTSADVVAIALSKQGDSLYTARVRRVVSGLTAPLGIELVHDTLFVAETALNANNPSPKLWEITLPTTTTGVLPGPAVADGFALYQNYPNPFNPTTTIRYIVGGVRDQASGVSNVRLSVYDLLGREVAVVVDERQTPGEHEVRVDGRSLASGMYFYRLTAGNYSAVRKMTIIK